MSFALLLMILATLGITGCGAGGYAGSGITQLSTSSATIDAGQSFAVTAKITGNEPVSWSLASSACTGSACGSVSPATGDSVTYTAPAGLSNQLKLTLDATITGTTSRDVVSVTVNPDPMISGTLPNGTVGTPYSAKVTASGGTAPLALTLSGPLPAGLSFNSSTGVISGTPTAAGTSPFTAQIVDSSDVPDTVTTPKSITILAPSVGALSLSGQPAAGTVGVAYTTTLTVIGGQEPYTFSVISGSLPAGLTLSSSTGVISGTPIAVGTSTFDAEVEDADGTKANTALSITINAQGGLSLNLATLPNAVVGTPYSATIGVSGGTAPYTCVLTGGAAPAGLSLGANCVVSGTPTTVEVSHMTVKATDSSLPAESTTGPETISVVAAGSLELTSPVNGTVGVAYNGMVGVSGGTAPYTCILTAGTLPAGLSMNAACVITGTPTTAGTATLTVKATDSGTPVKTTTGPVTLTIAPTALMLTLSSLPGAIVGTPYTATIGVTGGTAPYTCVQTGGTLPGGLALASNCVVSGTPTAAGTFGITVKASDSSSPDETVSGPESITVTAAGTLALSSPPDGTVGVVYSGVIGVTGGTSAYTCVVTGGTLPAGLTLGSGCVISGTPTTAGTSTVTVKATDSSTPARTDTGPVSLTIGPAALSLTLSTLPGATVGVAYSATVGVSGGTAPYTCLLASGTLPAGLSMSTSCVVSGTPTTAGTSTVDVKATDTSTPAETTTGPESITVSPAPLKLTLATLPGATIGVPYSATIGVSGGTSPYMCALTSGTLPAGLSMSAACVVSGTPTVVGTSTVNVKATDAGTPVETTTGPESITVSPAALTLTLTNLPNATVGTAYTATIGVAGGTSPYNCTLTAGTLPAGLSITGCIVSGTPTVAGSVTLTVKATDSGNPVETTTGPVGLTVLPAIATLTITSPPNATINVPYMGPIGITGGTGPYTCVLASGTLPAGLTLTGCTITGTPITAGASTVMVTVTDSSNPVITKTGPVTVTVLPATSTLTLTSPPNATVDTPYTGTIGVTGGTSPYTCTITAGALPTGLTLSAAGCVITGTPTTAGTSTVTVHATDSATPTGTTTGPVSITVLPIPTLTLTGSLPNAILGVPYTQTLVAAGGIKPYTFTTTAGSLPAGLTLSADGVVSGTPTVVGASSFTATVTDTETTPQTASLPLVLLVTYPTTPTDAELVGPYAFLFQGYDDVLVGVLAYQTATVGSFTADGLGGATGGEMDSNHQSSTATGNTISSNGFLATYTLAASTNGLNSTGFLTITTLNADGTTNVTSTYSLTVKTPVAPAKVATQADLIEYDNASLQGTRGSGTMLLQTATAFPAGLKGSYAFGLSGDSPCLPSCTIGIIAGPAASVGQFTTGAAGELSSGRSDANLATTNYADALLSGSFAPTDANGRLTLSMETANTPAGVYPTDYAVYIVNANKVFILSTDKHSEYVLLAGSAQLQTQATFSNASLNGPVIGYENTQANPDLLGTVLGNVLNFSSATIFRTTGNGVGTCNTTNSDTGGVSELVNDLGNVPLVADLLGTYQSTGTSACTVAANGRGMLNYPSPDSLLLALLRLLGLSGNPPAPREFYLVSPDNGYFLETGYAGLGVFEAQTGAPFSLATLDGSYVYASQPAASLASINSSGNFTANGLGSATTVLDENVGVGNINLLQLGATNTAQYTLSTPTIDGRYVFNTTTIIYAISPGRFVLVDTNPLTTSPSVSLLY